MQIRSIWIDFVAVNQHIETCPQQNQEDVMAFEQTLHGCKGGTIVVVDMQRCNPATR